MLSGGMRSTVAVAVAAAVIAASSGCGSDQPAHKASQSMITPTTQIAGAGVLGNDRKPDESCARAAAAADPGPPTRPAHNAAGVSPEMVQVPAEAQRIVVLSGDQLDALCALGLQSRIVAAALPNSSSSQPSYLGTTVHDLPGVGTRSAPDLRAIAAAHPDLILGSQGLTPQLYPQLAAIAPTVFTAAPGADWENNLRGVGAATARIAAVDALITGFAEHATQVGTKHDATHFQASIVQLTANTMRVCRQQPPGQRAERGRRRPTAVSTVHRQGLHRDRHHGRRPGEITGLLGGRRRYRLPVVRVGSSRGTRGRHPG
ncbi:Fe(III)-dicitrate-binding periplasmic lipoprotein fecB [Mycobacterium tuberculosis T17]|nr:Fe(III)-dicitrate-binding periplasmic lipoprotein fecB [Mycobacterium tuberculosis T17]